MKKIYFFSFFPHGFDYDCLHLLNFARWVGYLIEVNFSLKHILDCYAN